MNVAAVIAALALPEEARVDQRVPKKLLVEQGAPTAADRKHIQDGIEELTWVAALKPTNIGVPEFRDDSREYLEIAVLTADMRPAAKLARLTELIHRAIPYPLVLVSSQGESHHVSLAHKRFSQNERAATVLDSGVVVAPALRTAPLRFRRKSRRDSSRVFPCRHSQGYTCALSISGGSTGYGRSRRRGSRGVS